MKELYYQNQIKKNEQINDELINYKEKLLQKINIRIDQINTNCIIKQHKKCNCAIKTKELLCFRKIL